MSSTVGASKPTSAETIKNIEKLVYERLKPLGFRKHGKNLHRFVDGDISQIVYFRSDCYNGFDAFWVNFGIRIPECLCRKFVIDEPLKKYYHFAECNIRSGMRGTGQPGSWFLLHKEEHEKIIERILEQLNNEVIPFFDLFNNRDNIIKYRTDYPEFDQLNFGLVQLDEAMIWGRKGDIEKATEVFKSYYQDCLEKYHYEFEHGVKSKTWPGQEVTYLNTKTNQVETVVADKDGYYISFSAHTRHLNYLEKLAEELGIDIL